MEKIKLAAGGVVPHDQMVLCGDDCREEILPAATSKIELVRDFTNSLELDLLLLELEKQVGLMDGLPVVEVAAHE